MLIVFQNFIRPAFHNAKKSITPWNNLESYREIAEVVLRWGQLPESNIVLFGCDKKIGMEPVSFGYHFPELRSNKDMMVSKAPEKGNLSTELDEGISEDFRFCDACKSHDSFPSDEIRSMGIAQVWKNEAFRHMLALKHRLAPELLLEVVHHDEAGPMASPGEDENIRPLQVVHRFPQGSAWEKVHVAERAGCIQQNNVEISFETDVLKSIIQDKEVRAVPLKCKEARFIASLR